MKSVLYILICSFAMLWLACDSEPKPQQANQAAQQAEAAQNSQENITDDAPSEAQPSAYAVDTQQDEISQSSISELVTTELLQEVMEIPMPEEIKIRERGEEKLEITWPLVEGPESSAKLIFERGKKFDGKEETYNKFAEQEGNIMFFEELGPMSGFFIPSNVKPQTFFPLKGYMYSFTFPPSLFSEEMLFEKSKEMVIRIVELNR